MTSQRIAFTLTAALAATTGIARAQSPATPDLFLHSVPVGQPTGTTLPLSLADAVKRGLEQNLGVVLEQARVDSSGGRHLRDLADLLPHVSAGVRQSDQVVNLAAFGFTGFPGIPQVIGPFGVLDPRLFVNTPPDYPRARGPRPPRPQHRGAGG
ncbi:MAG: hypothetical protein ACHQO8_05505, partial [Vicinamibacterales bacterium]